VNDPHPSLPNANLQPSRSSLRALVSPTKPPQSPKTIYVAVVLLVFCIAGAIALPWLRGEKLRLLMLRNQIEACAAPDEPVLIDDWLLNRALQWKGSPALKRQLVYVQKRQIPPQLLAARNEAAMQEMVLVVPEGDPLAGDLQSHGYTLLPNASQAVWVAAGKGFQVPGHGVFRIYFTMHPNAHPDSSPAPEAKP
jgi:hypothetical protein